MQLNFKNFNPELAYLSMGAFLEPYLPTYSGGLEILAGDTLRSCADLRIPAIGIIQASNAGYFRQKLNREGWQIEEPIHWNPKKTLGRINERVIIQNKGRELYVGASPYIINGETGFKLPVFLLDTDFEENREEDRAITGMLYDNDPDHRIAQENVLGNGGVKLTKKLGFDSIHTFHINEGHAAFSTLSLYEEGYNEKEIKDLCVLTTHTPVAAGHDKWDYDTAYYVVEKLLPKNIKELAGEENLNMTKLALNLSRKVNAVSKKHAEVCREMEVFRGKNIDYVTNGIHLKTWVSKSMEEMFNSRFSHWSLDPRVLENATHISSNELLEAKGREKRHLVGYINANNPVKFSHDALTLVWARRFTSYKRPCLLFKDRDKLYELAEKYGGIQIIYSGKAHPADIEGKRLIQNIYNFPKENKNIRVVFIEDFNVDFAKMLHAGADVWLNTPRRPQEASGTSGMKAALNGCINLSSYDGWVVEGYKIEPEAIWLVGPKSEQVTIAQDWEKEDETDANGLYESLEQILSIYQNKEELGKRMAKSMSLLSYFNTHRVVKEYSSKLWNIPF